MTNGERLTKFLKLRKSGILRHIFASFFLGNDITSPPFFTLPNTPALYFLHLFKSQNMFIVY